MHEGHLRGTDPRTAVEAFRRAVELDPGLYSALFHLNHYAAVRGRDRELDSLTERLLAINPEGHSTRVLHVLSRGDAAARDSVLDGLASGRSELEPWMLSFTAWFVPDPRTAERIGAAFTAPGYVDGWQAFGHNLMASARLNLGKWKDARASLRRAAEFDPAFALEHRGYLTLIAPEELVAGDLDSLRVALAELDLLRAALGRAEALEAAEPRAEHAAFVGDLATVVRAEAARAEGEPERALEVLAAARLWTEYDLDERLSPLIGHLYPVFLGGELLRAAGREREALPWYRGLLLPLHATPNTLLRLRRAEILESLGEEERAAELYRQVEERWVGADPELVTTTRYRRMAAP